MSIFRDETGDRAAAVCGACNARRVQPIGDSAEWRDIAERSEDARRQVLEVARGAGLTDPFAFLRCRRCGHVFVEPMPNPARLAEFYRHYYANAAYFAKAEKKLRRDRRRIRRLRRHSPGRTFLDVGCNAGYAAEAARQLGFEATGIDLDPDSVGAARAHYPGCRFLVSDLGALARAGEDFDFVYCAEVIEHVPSPGVFVRDLAAVTARDGIVFLTTPDAGHFRVPARFLDWPEVKPPEHVHWFTKASLRTLFREHGFTIERFFLNPKPGIRMLARKAA